MSWFTKTTDEEIEALYRSHSEGIFRSLLARGAARETALDVVQSAFVKVYVHLTKTNDHTNIKSLLYTSALNIWRDEIKKKKSESLDDLHEEGFDEASALRADDAAQLHTVHTILAKLDAVYREVITLSILDELSPREIAHMLGLTANVVSVRLHRGMKQLKEMYEKQEFTHYEKN